jgi:predicted 2-oxoglutarate/Fe(II)-dependent dioxygenase YbiX
MNKVLLSPGIVIYKDAIKDRDNLLSLMQNVNYYELPSKDTRYVGITYIKDNEVYDKDITLIKDILDQSIEECLEDYCKTFAVDGIIPEDWQLVRYGEGQHFITHLDENYDNPRTVSITMYINNEYTGGELEYVWFNKIYKPEAGDIVIFPSNYIFSHKVHKVLSGIRYAVVRFYKWKTLGGFNAKY